LQTVNHLWQADPAVTKPLNLWLLGDGKPGHENQSLGLADALMRKVPCEVHRISLAGKSWLRRLAATSPGGLLPPPDLIIGAGHATHFTLLRLARIHGAKSIVLMKPSLPMSFFDLCIVPAHDFENGCDRKNVIVTRGALNRVFPPLASAREGKMILIGGPSGTHGWDGESLLGALSKITPGSHWQLTDSRRTPDGFIGEIGTRCPEIEIFPHHETTLEWLPARLAGAGEIWVTEDSVSMIYEALSTGAKVGILSMPRTRADTRVIRGLERLIADGDLTPFADWEKSGQLKSPPAVLREADRCAEVVLKSLSL
jgi:mitochondrial fission protein ELM1